MGSKCFLLICSVFFQIVYSITDQITTLRENELHELINASVKPCDDFYEFACGNYKTRYPIPGYRGKYETMDRMSEDNYAVLNTLLKQGIDEILQNPQNTAEEKAKAFYSLCNDKKEINDEGPAPLIELIRKLGGFPAHLDSFENWVQDPNFNWLNVITVMQSILYKNPFFFETFDLRDPMKVTNQSIPKFINFRFPLGETDNDKYKLRLILKELNFSEENANITFDEYYTFLDSLKTLDYLPPGIPKTAEINEFERLVPGFNWTSYLSGVYGFQFVGTNLIHVSSVEYYKNLVKLLNKKSVSEILNFLILNLIDGLLPVLDINFTIIRDKYNEVSQGYTALMPRWRQCVDLIIDIMNYPIATIFIKGTNLPENRDNVQQISDNIKSVFKQFLQNSSWPSVQTKNRTFEKLDAFQLDFSWENFIKESGKIDEDYRDLYINKSNFLETYIKAKQITIHRIGKLFYTIQNRGYYYYPLVNADAFIIPQYNTFSLHPGLLKPPFYHNNFPKFLEYGALGVVVAHEMFHSFDDSGSKYNAQGFLENWWTENELEEFQNRTECFVDQYANYTLYGKSLKDRPSNSEDIADSSGVKFAYMAYDKFLEDNPQVTGETVQGLNLTSRQLFFVSMAQFFCAPVRPEAVDYLMQTDAHATGPYRVIGIVQNSEDFSQQFQCSLGSPMNPSTKCNIYS